LVCGSVIKIFNIQNPAEPCFSAVLLKKIADLIVRDNTLFAIGKNGVYRYKMNPSDIKTLQLEVNQRFNDSQNTDPSIRLMSFINSLLVNAFHSFSDKMPINV
jgi:hypothetical protein